MSGPREYGVFLPVANGGWIVSRATPLLDGGWTQNRDAARWENGAALGARLPIGGHRWKRSP
jgi:hypothetical protein